MRAADLLVKCLEHEGVTHVFGLAGEEIMSVLDALADSDIEYVNTRHEQGAALMADVYGRLTGKPGVCLATLGPGTTNLMTGVADAFLDHAPLVAITGQVPLDRVHKESHQYIDTIGLFQSIVKWQARVIDGEVIPEVVRKAFKLAETEKPGPTHIELPDSVAGAATEGEPLAITPVLYPHAERPAVARAAGMIAAASRPMILAGNGVIRRRAAMDLRRFAEHTGIPVANTFMSKGVMGYTNPLAQLTVGLQNLDYQMCGLADADLVITVGYDMVEVAPRLWNARKDKKIVHIDTLAAEVDEHYLPDVELVSEIGTVLRDLTAACAPHEPYAETSRLKATVLGELERWAGDSSMPMKPQRILSDMRAVLKGDDLLISDVGAHKLWIARMFPAAEPNSVIVSNGFATMGIGVPGGIAAKLAQPDRRVASSSPPATVAS